LRGAYFSSLLVIARHEGASVWYSLADERIVEILDLMRGLLRTLLDESTRLAGSLGAGEEAATPS
jgi:DNA-binding transcriptional ArsR family regulator